ncbi:glycosyltransferase [Brumimicrobium glaciale]|uniref:Glycosyltransferase n=1 Tax=Brumimicrobium glaciale TaxID=200475 RepID=A0A4Q4KM12_9FLAO|nr:glycosyltransferase [Brumimicrobium glaciale]RYM34010.1 glycosyltransferase [Brumimicrobium glaciale]
MTIIHVVEPFATGINTFIRELVTGMPNDQHIIIHGERDDNRKLKSIIDEYGSNVKFVRWEHAQREIRIFKDLKSYFSLKKLLKQYSFDILHLHSSKAGTIGSFWSFINGKSNVVYTPNAVSFLRTDVSKIKIKLFKIIEKCIYRSGVNIVSCSPSEYDAYKDISVNTGVIRNGITIDASVKKNLPREKRQLSVVINGKITTQKNPEVINRIAKHFVGDSSIEFNWIGDGELKNVLKANNINILGWRTKEEVFEHLQSADLYLSASLWEGLPLSGIEAMSFKLPLILSDCSGNVDLVEDGTNGYTFHSEKQAIKYIEELKNNPQKIKRMSDNSQKMYENYNNYICAKNYRELYKKLTKIKAK